MSCNPVFPLIGKYEILLCQNTACLVNLNNPLHNRIGIKGN